MDKLRNRPFWQVLLAAIVVAIVCNVFFGWSFWLMTLVILSFWVAEKTTRWLYIVTVILIGVQAFNSFLPQTAKKSSWVTTATDLFMGSQVDSVQIKANMILEAEKNLQKDKLLPKYHDLLKEGRVEEARALLDSLDNLFSAPKKSKEVSAIIVDSIVVVREEIAQPVRVAPLHLGVSVFQLDSLGSETSWLRFPDNMHVRYKIASTDYGYNIVFSDGRVYAGDPNGVMPSTQYAVIKLVATKPNQFITVTLERI